MTALRAVAPNTGTYLNECDYFRRDWQRAFWGVNYPRLGLSEARRNRGGVLERLPPALKGHAHAKAAPARRKKLAA
jgi:hypothetical protein